MSKISKKELNTLGFTDNTIKSLLINILKKHYKHTDYTTIINLLKTLNNQPDLFYEHEFFGTVAKKLNHYSTPSNTLCYDLTAPKSYHIVGKKFISDATLKQMDIAMSLPIAKYGALLPDAHVGFGLPIGGVLATANEIIPYAVGVDIGCRMALTITDVNETFLNKNLFKLEQAIRQFTHFGMDGGLDTIQEHSILEDERFSIAPWLKKLKGKAAKQLGSSGSGNHFVDIGIIEIDAANDLNLKAGKYVAILTHSGSRGLGSSIASHYIKVAQEECKLPHQAQSLAWLSLDHDNGKEYWEAMHLAGDYAIACHENIHQKIMKALGLQSLLYIDNHHNFAWKEKDPLGNEVIVHRKGATPAHLNQCGIIPGSMISPAYLVKGKGNTTSIKSASHGAGRAMSKQELKNKTTVSEMNKILRQLQIKLIGGSIMEGPEAYKNINDIIQVQQDCISIQGKFYPKIVRMHKD